MSGAYNPMRMFVNGARPNFMKIASIVDAINAYNNSALKPWSYLLVHTGQHYDDKMSDAFSRIWRYSSPPLTSE